MFSQLISKPRFFKKIKLVYVLPLVCVAMGVILQLHNVLFHPVTRGFDAQAHINYIEYIRTHYQIPFATEGWEMYQSPLYYFLNAFLPQIQNVKFMGFVYYVGFLICAYYFLQFYFKTSHWVAVGLAVAATMPVVLYSSISISNEFFSTLIISITLTYYIYNRTLRNNKQKFILGMLLALSIGAKSTSFVLVATIVIDQLIESTYARVPFTRQMTIPLLLMVLLGGWYYLRNILVFGNPVVAPYELQYVFPFNEPVVERTFGFFANLRPFFTLDLFNAHHYAFFPGTYFSWFYDGHNIVVPVQAFSKIGVAVVLLSFLIFIFSIMGYVKEFNARHTANRVLLIYPLIIFISYILYNFHLPYASTVKGIFLVSTTLPMVYFFIKGIQRYSQYLLLINFYVFLYCLAIVKAFWILSTWYK